MTALRLSVCQPWRIRSDPWATLSALVGTGLVVGAISAMRGREPTEVALAAAFSAVFAALAWIDLERRVIPNHVVYPALILALGLSPAWPDRGLVETLVGGFAALVVGATIRTLTGRGLGGGDVKLAVLGAMTVGYRTAALAGLAGAVAGGVAACALLGAGRARMGDQLPFGPFIAFGVVAALVTGA